MEGKKPVYNGYIEDYLTGAQIKSLFKDQYYGTGRHHETVMGISIDEYLTTMQIENPKQYRIFYNDVFCRVMDAINDKQICFFAHFKKNDIVFCKEPSTINLNVVCPQCGSKMKFRSGKYGIFLGCSSYPDCTYTENIPIIGSYRSFKIK